MKMCPVSVNDWHFRFAFSKWTSPISEVTKGNFKISATLGLSRLGWESNGSGIQRACRGSLVRDFIRRQTWLVTTTHLTKSRRAQAHGPQAGRLPACAYSPKSEDRLRVIWNTLYLIEEVSANETVLGYASSRFLNLVDPRSWRVDAVSYKCHSTLVRHGALCGCYQTDRVREVTE